MQCDRQQHDSARTVDLFDNHVGESSRNLTSEARTSTASAEDKNVACMHSVAYADKSLIRCHHMQTTCEMTEGCNVHATTYTTTVTTSKSWPTETISLYYEAEFGAADQAVIASVASSIKSQRSVWDATRWGTPSPASTSSSSASSVSGGSICTAHSPSFTNMPPNNDDCSLDSDCAPYTCPACQWAGCAPVSALYPVTICQCLPTSGHPSGTNQRSIDYDCAQFSCPVSQYSACFGDTPDGETACQCLHMENMDGAINNSCETVFDCRMFDCGKTLHTLCDTSNSLCVCGG